MPLQTDPEKATLRPLLEQRVHHAPRMSRCRTAVLLLAATAIIFLGLVYIWGLPLYLVRLPQLVSTEFTKTRCAIPPSGMPAATQTEFQFPVLVWHGLGDWHDGEAIHVIQTAAVNVFGRETLFYPVHFEEDESKERGRSFQDNVLNQIDEVCEMIKGTPSFEKGFVGVGLSQGGLFLRILQQTCLGAYMRTLITLGSPHQGFNEISGMICNYLPSLCNSGFFRKMVFTDYIQSHVVPATYFKPYDLHEEYLRGSKLLGRYNYEKENDQDSPDNMKYLEHFVMVMFKNDTKLVPARSAWFDDLDSSGKFVPMNLTATYKNIGLEMLDKTERLHRIEFEGDHLQFSAEQMTELFCKYTTHRENVCSGIDNRAHED